MQMNNGFSELAKLIFKNSADEEKLKQLLSDNYSEPISQPIFTAKSH